MIKSEGIKAIQHPVTICLVALILFFAIANPVMSFYSGFTSYFSVGTDISEFIVGSTSAVFLVGEGVVSSTSPASEYTGLLPILYILPGLLLLALIIVVSTIGFRQIQQGEVVAGIIIFSLSFLLIGFALLIGMPILLDGIQATMWYK